MQVARANSVSWRVLTSLLPAETPAPVRVGSLRVNNVSGVYFRIDFVWARSRTADLLELLHRSNLCCRLLASVKDAASMLPGVVVVVMQQRVPGM